MAAMKAKQFEEDAAVKVHRIRITLTSRNVKNLEKGEPPLSCTTVVVHTAQCETRIFYTGALLVPSHTLRRQHTHFSLCERRNPAV